MSDADISCPKCGHAFPLTDTLAGPVVDQVKRDYEARLKALDTENAQALAAQKAEIEAAAKEAAQKAQATELETLKAMMADQAEKLAEAQKAQAAAMKREMALAEREQAIDLDLQKRLKAALTEAEERRAAEMQEQLRLARADAAEEAVKKVTEKDQLIEGLTRQIETLKQKAEQGSQQRQGEAAEVILEDSLMGAFPTDTVTPVGKGVRGADCVQTVTAVTGPVGKILWEVKRTRNWAKDWLPKLREDQRQEGADVAVLVSEVRPDEVPTFGLVDGVWVAAPRYAVPLASVLRGSLLEVAQAKGARQGQATKTEMLYDYLTGPQFRARVEAVVERFEMLRDDLERERKTMMSLWAKREKALGLARDAMVGMYGDVQGIAGASVPDIEGLEPPLIERDDD